MRKILITKELQDRVNDFCDKLFYDRDFEKPLVSLDSLKKKIAKSKKLTHNKKEKKKKYLEKIIKDYSRILKATPSEIKILCEEFDKIIDSSVVAADETFYKSILSCLRYDELRNKEYLDFAFTFGYKCCFYCNAQLAVILPVEFFKINYGKNKKGDLKERKATFELDHVKAKSKYPFLSTSFFNLIPSCSICNKAKSNKSIEFNFYEEDPAKLSFIDFELDESVIQTYWKTKNKEDLNFTYKIEGVDKDSFNEIFRVQEIYDTQKDIIEELLYIKELYTPAYKQSIIDLLNNKLYTDTAMIDRIIMRNYARPEDCYKRPFAKFTQDIASKLKLIT
ncbi:HNH endonuclease [Flavobacterium sp. NRK1]|uniref:HNH endonuclease n=1 Tax=Flavobacterium sp. NRK1 TaxID=2954929 RepID=UPI002091F743|nr:HNH endonuclease [Flavobacterium sp. NRK1]MCO6147908.1 HNH endonuclease [Flavobacterium sp. NRK1]